MIFKLIDCKVVSEQQSSFSIAQEQWKGISKSSGLIGQFGGWHFSGDNSAKIISL